MSYIALKHLHTTLATLTLLVFLLRGAWAMMGSAMLEKKWAKITPHVVYTLLLVSAFAVAWVGWGYPQVLHGWITAKLIALVVFIAAAVMAFRGHGGKKLRLDMFLVALVVYAYIVVVALTKSATII